MAYHLGNTELVDEGDAVVLRRVDANVKRLVKEIEDDAKRRRLTVILTGVGVLFAAVKLGFVAVPHVRQWRTGR